MFDRWYKNWKKIHQPIEATAVNPDLNTVLVWAQFVDKKPKDRVDILGTYYSNGYGWIKVVDYYIKEYDRMKYGSTHWMPLPADPH